MDYLYQGPIDQYMPGTFVQEDDSSSNSEEGDEPPKGKALKEEYASPEWKAWRRSDFRGPRPDWPIDIIAVQGLASKYRRTWTKTVVSDDGTKKNVMWLKDLLPQDLPSSRILTFEYNSQWRENPANVTLEDCAIELLRSIRWDRKHKGEDSICASISQRPLILMGHSYGGLVIKQAMVLAAGCDPKSPLYDDFQSILGSVTGILFLGTPHGGSNLAKYAVYHANFLSWFGGLANPHLLKPLEMDSNRKDLSQLQAKFDDIRRDTRAMNLRFFYFWETEACQIRGWRISDIQEVVSEDSACLGAMHNERMPLNTSHQNMNKFGDSEDSNYKKIKDCLKSIHDESKSTISRRLGKSRYGGQFSSGRLVQLRNWLDPMRNTHIREDTLRRLRYQHTCEWATRLEVVSHWMDPYVTLLPPVSVHSSNCLWVYGKPGSGKSVLSAFLYDQVSAIVATHNQRALGNASCPGFEDSESCAPGLQAELWTAVYFPFHENATVQQAIVTMIHRILSQHPANQALQEVSSGFQDKPITPVVAMQLLVALIRKLSLTYIIIDGLEECAQTADMNLFEVTEKWAEVLKDLSELANVRLLILSRRDLMIGDLMMQLISSSDSMVDMAAHNSSDIKLFIDIHISDLADARSLPVDVRKYIIEYITSESRGMFQWVKLVIQQLKTQRGDEREIIKLLNQFPANLDDAYRKTFDRLRKSAGYNKDRAVLALKWLTCSRRALTTRELRAALEIQENLPHFRPDEDVQGIKNIMARVDAMNEEELKDYFIQLLGPLAEFYRHNSMVNVIDDFGVYRGTPPVIMICHHSLRQLLYDNTAELYGFNFSESAAHFLVADTCMRMMCTPRALETFLEHFYSADEGDRHTKFLDYAVEHWSSHLRASGIRSEGGNLTDLTLYVLGENLNLSLLAVGALSEACSRLSMAKVDQMMQAIAIRDCQGLMLPLIEHIVSIRQSLPSIALGLDEMSLRLQRLGRLKQADASNLDGTNVAKVATLDDELDSIYMVEIFKLVSKDPELYRPIRKQLEDIRQTARTIRSLTIKLSVDPIRAWLYHLIGDHGLNPIPVLAMTTHALDLALASFLLPATTNDQSNFTAQFHAQPRHPLYGFIQSARNEVNKKEMKVFNAADYKEHVLPHYLLKKAQWFCIYFTTLLLGTSLYGIGGANMLINRKWHSDSMFIAYEGDIYEEIRFSDAFDNYEGRYYKKGIATPFTEILSYLSIMVVVVLARILTLLNPHIGMVISEVIDQFNIKTMMFRPWITSLLDGWRHSSIAVVLYVLRLRYCFWLFSYFRKTPWTDLKGILSDPFHYQSSIDQTGWAALALLLAQEAVVGYLTSYDLLRILKPDAAADEGPNLEPRRLYRQISFRFREFGPSVKDNVIVVVTKLSRHAREIAMALARLIFIERTYYEVSYIMFDTLQITVHLMTPSSWTFSRLLFAVYNILGQAILAWCLQRMGVQGTIRFFWHLYVYWLRLKFFWYILTTWWVTRFIFVEPSIWIWNLIKMPFIELAIFFRWILLGLAHYVSLAAQYVAEIVWFVGPTVLVLFTATLLVLFFIVFIVLFTDPLQLRRAAYSCKKARTVATRATKNDHLIRSLHWKAGDLKRIESIPLTDLKELNYIGGRSAAGQKANPRPPQQPKSAASPRATPTPRPKCTNPKDSKDYSLDPFLDPKLVKGWLRTPRNIVPKADTTEQNTKDASRVVATGTPVKAVGVVTSPPPTKAKTEVTVTSIDVTETLDVDLKQEDESQPGTGAEFGGGAGTARRRKVDFST